MASHAGLKYILETKKGYVKDDGSFTDKESDALLIDYMRFGFIEAERVYIKLGFNDKEVLNSGVSFHTIIPSYESRDLSGLSTYLLMGYDYKNAFNKAQSDYFRFNLSNDENLINYQKKQKEILLKYHIEQKEIKEILCTENVEIPLYKTNDTNKNIEGCLLEYYYSKIGRIYKYSIPLKNPHVENYFNLTKEKQNYYNYFQQEGLIEYFKKKFNENKFSWGLKFNTKLLKIEIINDKLIMYLDYFTNINNNEVAKSINFVIRDYYSEREMHITRMFGSFILLQKIGGELKAVEATPVPIKYCPLMIKLLKEVGGKESEKLINAIKTEDATTQTKMMCNLIDNIVIKGGYFDTSRPLNSCEANVLFGASETISSAFKSNLIDAAVIVSNNLGTIITTNSENTQGAVKRMTGLFYTSPSKEIIEEAENSKIIPVFPYSATIDQVKGVKKAIEMGYKKIVVTLASQDNELLKEIAKLESEEITIYKFGLCSTGINENTAKYMLKYADIIWSCASKYVKSLIEPNAIAQVGIKIPVHIMTKKGWELVRNHLEYMSSNKIEEAKLTKGEEKNIFLCEEGQIKRLVKKDLRKCSDCPHPCI